MNVRNDKKDKKDLEKYDTVGDLAFPFMIGIPNNRLLSALEESEDIINGKIKTKRYTDFDSMLDDLD